MKRLRWWPITIGNKRIWFVNFKPQFAANGADLGFSSTEISDNNNDIDWLIWAIDNVVNVEARYHQITAVRDLIFSGIEPQDIIVPSHISIPAPGSVIKEGALGRVFDRVRRLKEHTNYNEDLGRAMMIIGAEDPYNEAETYAKIRSINIFTDKIVINFKKDKFPSVVLYCKRGAGDFEKVGVYAKPPIADTRPNFSEEPEQRIYKVRYILDDKEYGNFSPEWVISANVH